MNRHAVIGLLAAVGLAPLSTGCQLLRDDSNDSNDAYHAYLVKNSKGRFDTPPTGTKGATTTPKPDAQATGIVTAGATAPPANQPPELPARPGQDRPLE